MSEPSKKQNFLQGAALLAIATAIVKLIGAFYKLPLNMAIGAEGYSYFTTAYDIYSVMLLISTAGLPVAVSRMISQASTLEHSTRMRKIFRTALVMFAFMGALTSVLMIFGAKPLANVMNQPDAWISIACLGPCGILICLMSAYRGYFNGQRDMAPTSVTQVIEAFVKLVVGLALAFLLIRMTGKVALAAGGAILGVTMGSAIALVYMLAKFRPAYRSLPVTDEDPGTTKDTVKELLTIAIPITIGSAGLQLLTVIESGLYMDRLVHLMETGQYMSHMVEGTVTAQKAAATLKGLFNMTQTIFNMPCAFIPAITMSIIPAITSHITLMNDKAVCATEESAARITGLISMPCAVGLFILGEPVTALIGGYEGEKLVLAGQLMALMGVGVFFYSIVQLTNAVMQAHGHASIPVVNMLLAGVMRLIIVYLLTGNPSIQLLGAPIGAALCYLCIGILNLIAMRKVIPQKPAITKNLLRPLIPSVVMGIAALAVWLGLKQATDSRLFLCAIPVMVGVAIYAFLAIKLKAITKEDCLLLPKGDKIAKILHL